jgi:DNA polymerase-3 subunit chi
MHVEFYVFEKANEQQVDVALCHLIEKWYHAQWSVAILCPSIQKAQKLDQLLWSFNDQSFIPHEVVSTADTKAPILLCLDLSTIPQSFDVILNLSETAITTIKPTQMLVEIVFSEHTMQQLARERYKQYRDQGYQLKTIKTPVSKVSA